jgi:hypothetical protein
MLAMNHCDAMGCRPVQCCAYINRAPTRWFRSVTGEVLEANNRPTGAADFLLADTSIGSGCAQGR